MEYDLELERAADEINKSKAKTVVIQLPDGLKPKADEIAKELSEKTSAQISIWLGSCYGACDIPKVDADLLIQWGHSEWKNNTLLQ
jgi:2-(3-amino-3-carboxypropyl)histidine synthase